MKVLEKERIRGAIRTDFILSAEIIAITLGTVSSESIGMQFLVLAVVALFITIGVYGLVAGIVKLDDGGLYLSQRDSPLLQSLGRGILWLAPYMMKTLSILGTIAMFLVGGGILVHGIPPVYQTIHDFSVAAGGILQVLLPILANGVVGLIAGALLVAVITPLLERWKKTTSA